MAQAGYQPRERTGMLRKPWDFPKARAAGGPEELKEMPRRVRNRYRREAGIGECTRVQTLVL